MARDSDQESLRFRDQYGMNPLHWAAKSGRLKILRYLVETDSEQRQLNDPPAYNMRDDGGWTPVFCSGSVMVSDDHLIKKK